MMARRAAAAASTLKAAERVHVEQRDVQHDAPCKADERKHQLANHVN